MKRISNIVKNTIRFISCAWILVSMLQVSAQTVVIPDPNFRAKLMSSYPSVMTGNQLNVTAAKNYVFDVILTGSNISDLTGLEYFTGTFKIDVSDNNVTALPTLSGTSPIKYLYANNNKLVQLPVISSLTSLTELQVSNNKLTSLPQLNTLTSLVNLIATNNQLTSLPPITNLVNLKVLNVGINPLGSLPDLSPNYNLNELHCHQTGITEIKGLVNLTQLKRLFCWGNNISDLSALSANTTLNTLYAFGNKLSALPTLTNKPLFSVEIASNQLTFEDLLPLTGLNLFDFSYSPQDSLGATTTQTTRLLHPLTLTIAEDASVTNNVYAWTKNNTVIAGVTTNTFSVTDAQASDAGDYFATITNPGLPNLTLTHRLWRVATTDCVNLTSYSLSVLANDCTAGATISSTVLLDGGITPYRYSLVPFATKDSIRSVTGDFTQIAPGQYSYVVRDANNCGMDTTVTIAKPNKCDPVITPNGDQQMNSYFIQEAGTAKIIDLGGNTIMQLTTPAVWYGTRSDGSLAEAGYYVILLNNKKLTNITVIR